MQLLVLILLHTHNTTTTTTTFTSFVAAILEEQSQKGRLNVGSNLHQSFTRHFLPSLLILSPLFIAGEVKV